MRRRVRFGETDAAGIVYYPTFFSWFDDATHALLRRGGESMRDADGRPRDPLPIVEANATFVAPLRFDEEITVVSRVSELGTSSLRVEHEVYNGDRLAARGFERRVHVRFENGRVAAAALPDELRGHLAADVAGETP
jgi:acyl-CoA thioester hydrolase